VDPEVRCRELIRRPDAIEEARRVEQGDRAMAAGAEMELVVLAAVRQGCVEPSGQPQTIAAQDDR